MTQGVIQLRTRRETIDLVAKQWGYFCFLCPNHHEFDSDDEITIDHWMPQSFCYANGWTLQEVWAINNLRLACKPSNARKGDMVPVDDFTVPTRIIPPKDAKAGPRPATCDLCMNGRLLLIDELCELCGSEPQPKTAPRALQKSPKECDHFKYHCWMCYIGHVPRKTAGVYELIVGDDNAQ